MPNPVAYNSSTTPAGTFKRSNVSYGLMPTNYGVGYGSLSWYNSLDTTSKYVIVSDTYTLGLSTQGNTKPVMWSTGNTSNQNLINLINGLPGNTTNFTDYYDAVNWLQGTNKYFLLNNGYENIVTNGLVLNLDAAWWNSYPTTGTTWTDLSGNNNGTLTNGPTYNSSNGGSIVFDGVDDYSLLSNSGYNVGVNFSIQTWVKINRWGGGPNWNRASVVTNSYTYNTDKGFWIACTSQAGPAQNYVATPGLETFFLSIGADQYCVSPQPGSLSAYTNSWFNIGIRVNGTNLLKCYINGVEPLSYGCQTNGPSTISYDSAPFSLANRNSGTIEPLSGSIGIFSMYNRALSDSEFLQNYNATKSRFGL